jgi:hypothetical protein
LPGLLDPLHRAAEAASEAGDFEYACISEGLRGAMMAITGCRLPEFERAMTQLSWTQWFYAVSVAHANASRIYSVLKTETDLKQALMEVRSAHERTPDLYLYISIHIITVHLVLGEFEGAFEEAERVREPMFCAHLGTHIADFVFLHGWAAASVARTARGARRRAARRTFRRSLAALRRWAHPGSDFVHMHQLLNAEHLRLRGDVRGALAVYAKGAGHAREHGHRHHAALAHERRAELLIAMGRKTEARTSLREAVALYAEWGATVKVASLASDLSDG